MTNLPALDPLDCRILAELQRDATLSNAQLAERVGSTGPSCWRRVRAMQDQGLLRRAVWIADPHALGQGVIVLCHVRMKEFSAEAIAAFEDFVRAHEQVMECYPRRRLRRRGL